MRNNTARLITSLSFFCLLASSAWAGPIRHPSDYGVDPLTTCGSQTVGPVEAVCYLGGGGFPNDLLFNFSLVSPLPSTSITSVTILSTNTPTGFGLIEGDSADPCSGDSINVPCTPDTSLVAIADSFPLGDPNTFTFSNFTGDLSGKVTMYLSFDAATEGFLTGDTTSSSVTTPEPSEIGLLIGAGSLIVVRRRQRAKQNV